MQCPPDFPAAALVVALGSTVGRRCGIRPKRRDDWLVVPNLWGGIVGRPSLLKTPALHEALRPLRRLEAEAGTAHREAMKAHEANLAIAKQAKKLREAQIAKDLKAKRDPKGIAHDLMQAEEAFDAPIECRYLTNDPTVEKLGELLRDNPAGAMLFRDELAGWLKGLDKDGREGDRAFYLECWDGAGAYTYDRIGRGTIRIEAACVSVLGGIQPGPLATYLEAATRGGAGDDGLMQRFQVIVWPDPPPVWRDVDRLPDAEARDAAFAVFRRLAAIEAASVGAEDEAEGIPFLRFDPDA